MHTDPTGLDEIAAIIAIGVALLAIVTILGVAAVMAVMAMIGRRQLVTSWPAQQEQSFAGYERQNSSSASMAWMGGLLTGGVVFAAIGIICLTTAPREHDLGKDMNMSNISKKKTADAPAPAPAAEKPAAAPDAK